MSSQFSHINSHTSRALRKQVYYRATNEKELELEPRKNNHLSDLQ